MANTGKYVSSAQDIVEHAAKIAALQAIPPSVKPICFYEVGDVAAMLKVDPKTLKRRRDERDAALKSGAEINPLSIASIRYAPPNPTVKYSAEELENYLMRLAAASASPRNVNSADHSSERQASAFMGFQTWMSIATPVDTWPYSIQSDGRPMDMCAAIILGAMTGAAERLTLRQFSERLADASARAFQEREREELEVVARVPNPQRPVGES